MLSVAVAVQELVIYSLCSLAAVVVAAAGTVAAVAGEELVAVEATFAVALERFAVPAESVVQLPAFVVGWS